jgi:hypothetical protein
MPGKPCLDLRFCERDLPAMSVALAEASGSLNRNAFGMQHAYALLEFGAKLHLPAEVRFLGRGRFAAESESLY